METQAKKPKYMDKDQQHRLMAAYYTAITDLLVLLKDFLTNGGPPVEDLILRIEEMQKFFFNPKNVEKNEKVQK